MARAKSWLEGLLLFAACLTASQLSVAQVTVPGTLIQQRRQRGLPGSGRGGDRPRCPTKFRWRCSRCRRAPRSASRATMPAARRARRPARRSAARAASFVDLAAAGAAGRRTARSARRRSRCTDTSVAHAGDPVFVRVVDLDRNRDGSVVETVDVRVTARATGDAEVLRLVGDRTEYRRVRRLHRLPRLRPPRADCTLEVERNSETRGDLRRSDRRHRCRPGRRAGRSLRPGVRFADGQPDQRRARAPHRRDHGASPPTCSATTA